MERRDFLKTAAAAGVTAVSAGTASAQAGKTSDRAPVKRPEMPGMLYRELGTTGERVSAIGLGGYHLDKDGKIPEHDAIAWYARPSTQASPSWTTAGTTTTASARSVWARRSRMVIGRKSF